MDKKTELMPGTLDMLILRTLARAPLHGYGIALSIKRLSDDLLTVEEGSLYPALQRLLLQGWVKAEWKMTETKRRARYYTLTAAGRKQLGVELTQFEQMVAAIGRGLQGAGGAAFDQKGGRERRLEDDAIRAAVRCGAARRIYPALTHRAKLCRAYGAGLVMADGGWARSCDRREIPRRCGKRRRASLAMTT